MEKLSKKERILAALNGDEVDRVPVSLWLHYPDQDQDPRSLAETQINFMHKYDLDFIKVMPFGLYTVQDWGCKVKIFGTPYDPPIVADYGIKDVNDWKQLEEFNGTYGTWGKQVQVIKYLNKYLKEDVPFIQTIFSPLTTARKLAGDRVLTDMKENPEIFHQALQVITNTTINFIKENINAGVSGFFFATQCASYDFMTDKEYDEFGAKYDLQLFNAFSKDTFFNVIHIHGQNVMFEKVANYPGNCINWHDRWVGPSLDEARKITDKCLLGGLNENKLVSFESTADITKHVHEAIDMAGKKKFILGPGCVADTKTPALNYYSVRMALENY